jgi:histidinol dehydrogenase
MFQKGFPSVASIEDHRGREKGVLVYPVYSRRSGGLSVGINLFPDKKLCSFDCPYCEVFPFPAGAEFSPERMEEDLTTAITAAMEREIPVRDICFSGNGEPTMSAYFPEALERAGRVRREMAPGAVMVLITNGSGLLDGKVFSLLHDAASGALKLDIWLKLDAGTPEWYKKMNRCNLPFEKITEKIKEFAACAPVTIQTMICAVDGEAPPPEEERSWENLILELAANASPINAAEGSVGAIRKVQIYGKARPSPEDPKAAALPEEILERRAASLRASFAKANDEALAATLGAINIMPKVEVYP